MPGNCRGHLRKVSSNGVRFRYFPWDTHGLQLHSNKVPQEVRFKDLVIETFPKEQRLLTVK
jgi:hypothetical protein